MSVLLGLVSLISLIGSVIALVRSFRLEHMLNEEEHDRQTRFNEETRVRTKQFLNHLNELEAAERRERERNADR